MADLEKLQLEHARLVTIVRGLGHVIAQPRPPRQVDLFELRRELASTLIAHLKAEDWLLYPRLIASGDDEAAVTAQAFHDEMGGMAAAFIAHTERWSALAISADWPGYCAATRAILADLTSRIDREDRELYPLLARVDRAA